MATEPSRPKPQRSDSVLRYAGMATQMAVTIGIAVWGGRWLDQRFPNDWHAWTLSLSILGVGSAIYMVIKDLLRP